MDIMEVEDEFLIAVEELGYTGTAARKLWSQHAKLLEEELWDTFNDYIDANILSYDEEEEDES